RASAREVVHAQPRGDAGGAESPRPEGAQRHGPERPRGADSAALRGPVERRGRPGAADQAHGGGQPLRAGPQAAQGRVPGDAGRYRGALGMNDSDISVADPFGQIADEFVEAFRQGKHPSVEDFARRYPEHAQAIREMLPALVLMEQAKSADESPSP